VKNVNHMRIDPSRLAQIAKDLPAALEAARSIARSAGQQALALAQGAFDAETKAVDGSPVTLIDRETDRLITEFLRKQFPLDEIISEEGGRLPGSSGRTWWIDPIDGTRELIARSGEWSVMIGLEIAGEPLVGVVYQPTTDELYYGAFGLGAYKDSPRGRQSLQVRSIESISEAVMALSRNHPDERVDRISREWGVRKAYKHGSVGLKMAHVAEGRADLYFNFSRRCHKWDLCGPAALLRAAGGSVLLLDGSDDVLSGEGTSVDRFFSAPPGLTRPVIERLARFLDSD
jgi:3'(2'), 5'-bisphosphate nucleotidase